MAIWADENTRVVVQGLTGKEGQFHAAKCREYGTQIVAGVTPGKAGVVVDGVPVFNTVDDAVAATGANAALIFVFFIASLPCALRSDALAGWASACGPSKPALHRPHNDDFRVFNQGR